MCIMVLCLFLFYGMWTLVGYLMPNPFLYKEIIRIQTIQFSISIKYRYQNSSISNDSV